MCKGLCKEGHLSGLPMAHTCPPQDCYYLLLLMYTPRNVPCVLQVIMTAWKAEGVPDWDQLHNRADTMWHKASWAKGVLVDNASSAAGSQDLFRVVQVNQTCACTC